MPWTVLPANDEQARRRIHEPPRRALPRGDTIEAVLVQTSALLRRHQSEDMSAISAKITGAPHCVPCLSLVTKLDARRIYAALERLKAQLNVRLVWGRCTQCGRTTTAQVIEQETSHG